MGMVVAMPYIFAAICFPIAVTWGILETSKEGRVLDVDGV